jgi:hypothetical protein
MVVVLLFNAINFGVIFVLGSRLYFKNELLFGNVSFSDKKTKLALPFFFRYFWQHPLIKAFPSNNLFHKFVGQIHKICYR